MLIVEIDMVRLQQFQRVLNTGTHMGRFAAELMLGQPWGEILSAGFGGEEYLRAAACFREPLSQYNFT